MHPADLPTFWAPLLAWSWSWRFVIRLLFVLLVSCPSRWRRAWQTITSYVMDAQFKKKKKLSKANAITIIWSSAGLASWSLGRVSEMHVSHATASKFSCKGTRFMLILTRRRRLLFMSFGPLILRCFCLRSFQVRHPSRCPCISRVSDDNAR